jgi:hypothetical protein
MRGIRSLFNAWKGFTYAVCRNTTIEHLDALQSDCNKGQLLFNVGNSIARAKVGNADEMLTTEC